MPRYYIKLKALSLSAPSLHPICISLKAAELTSAFKAYIALIKRIKSIHALHIKYIEYHIWNVCLSPLPSSHPYVALSTFLTELFNFISLAAETLPWYLHQATWK